MRQQEEFAYVTMVQFVISTVLALSSCVMKSYLDGIALVCIFLVEGKWVDISFLSSIENREHRLQKFKFSKYDNS